MGRGFKPRGCNHVIASSHRFCLGEATVAVLKSQLAVSCVYYSGCDFQPGGVATQLVLSVKRLLFPLAGPPARLAFVQIHVARTRQKKSFSVRSRKKNQCEHPQDYRIWPPLTSDLSEVGQLCLSIV